MVASGCSLLPQNHCALENLSLARYTSFRLESNANNIAEKIVIQKISASSYEFISLMLGNSKCGLIVFSPLLNPHISFLTLSFTSLWKNQQLSVNGKQKGNETVILLLASGISIRTITHMLEWVTPLYLDSMTHFKVSRRFPVVGLACLINLLL